MSETPSPPATLAARMVEQFNVEGGLPGALRWLAKAARDDAGRRAANKRPELAEIPGGALKLMATLVEGLADDIEGMRHPDDAPEGAGMSVDTVIIDEIAGAPAAEGQRAPGEIERVRQSTLRGGAGTDIASESLTTLTAPVVTIDRTDLTTGQTERLAGTKLTTVFADESGAKVASLGAAVVEAAEAFHDGSPLEFVFDIVAPEPWEPGPEQVGAAPPFPPEYFADPSVANEHAPGSAPKA